MSIVLTKLKFSLLERRISKLNVEKIVENNDSLEKGIAIITTAESANEAQQLLALQQKFKLKNDHFKFIVCTPRPMKVEDERALFFSASEIKANGSLTNPKMARFLQANFKSVIGFSRRETKLFQLIFKLAQAPLKIVNLETMPSANLVIKTDDVIDFKSELLKYWKTIKQIR